MEVVILRLAQEAIPIFYILMTELSHFIVSSWIYSFLEKLLSLAVSFSEMLQIFQSPYHPSC